MKKTARILIIFVILCFACAFVGCAQVQTTLNTPQNVQVIDNVVYWNSVDGALGYYVSINMVEYSTSSNNINLSTLPIASGTQCSIMVKAQGDGYLKLSSAYSQPITYTYIAKEIDNNTDNNDNAGNNSGNNSTGNNNTDNNSGSNTGNNNTGNNNTNTPDSGTNDGNNNTDNNDNNQTVQPKPVTFKSAYYNLGIGRTVNALQDRYLTITNVPKGIFTIEDLETLEWICMQSSNPGYIMSASGSSMEEYYSSRNDEYGIEMSMNATISGIFTVGITNNFKTSEAGSLKQITEELYYSFSQYMPKYNISVTERTDLEKVKDIIKQSVLEDAKNMTAKEFFDTYGTHVVLAADIGGKVDGYYYIAHNTEEKWAESTSEIANSIELGIKDLVDTKLGGYNKLSETFKLTGEIKEEHFSCECVGGDNSFAMLNFNDFMNNYGKWADSLNNKSVEELVVIGAPKEVNSLVAIWDLLPDSYGTEKEKLRKYFSDTADSTAKSLYNDYRRDPNNGDITNFAGGYGSETSPYLISKPEHLNNIKKFLTKQPDAYYELTQDIPIDDVYSNWEAIGAESGNYTVFKGHLDGKGKTISGLKCSTSPTYDSNKVARYGLFALLGEKATVKNIVFDKVDINITNTNTKVNHYMNIGVLCGEAGNCEISNVGINGNINCSGVVSNTSCLYVGGIVGQISSDVKITYCYNKANMNATHELINIGGICGRVEGDNVIIKYSYYSGELFCNARQQMGNSDAYVAAGGILGRVADKHTATVQNCYTYFKIRSYLTGTGTLSNNRMGGIVGVAVTTENKNTVKDNYSCYYWTDSKTGEINKKGEYEIRVSAKKLGTSNNLTDDQIKGGTTEKPIGSLGTYNYSDVSSGDCWIYQSGSLPKLYWEK